MHIGAKESLVCLIEYLLFFFFVKFAEFSIKIEPVAVFDRSGICCDDDSSNAGADGWQPCPTTITTTFRLFL